MKKLLFTLLALAPMLCFAAEPKAESKVEPEAQIEAKDYEYRWSYITETAPVPGTFYRNFLGYPPLAQVGDIAYEDTILYLLEINKMFCPVSAVYYQPKIMLFFPNDGDDVEAGADVVLVELTH